MLKLIETFDNIVSADDLFGSIGWARGDNYNPSSPHECELLPGMGRMGTQALMRKGWQTFPVTLPALSPTSRIVLGMAVRHPVGGQGAGSNANGQSFILIRVGYGTPAQGPAMDIIHFTIKLRCDRISSGWSIHPAGQDFMRMEASMWTGETSVRSGQPNPAYPEIVVAEPYIQTPYGSAEYTFLEFFVDCADISNGRVKIAANGKTFIDISGILTTNVDAYGSDPYDQRSKLTHVSFNTYCGNGYWANQYPTNYLNWLIDTVYLCDAAGGFQNDFLGPVMSQSYYPISNGDKNNWTPYVNSEVYDDGRHFDRINYPVALTDETEFIEGDVDLLEEMYFFPDDSLPMYSDIVAINHRTTYRNLGMPNHPTPNSLSPIFKVSGNDKIITHSATKRLEGYNYQLLDIYYGTVPGPAIPWTKYLLSQSQFGFLLKASINTQTIESVVGISDECSEE